MYVGKTSCESDDVYESEVFAEAALVFSTLENGLPRLSCERLVYDPQSGDSASVNTITNCSASESAIVLNRTEAGALLAESGVKVQGDNAADMADLLLETGQFSVVVLKDGPLGGFVATTQHAATHFPVNSASRVFSIGSGDIFSGRFAIEWALRKRAPLDAAQLASRATAAYCESQNCTSQDSIDSPLAPDSVRQRTIYLAGPFRTAAQVSILTDLCDFLSGLGHEVRWPYAHFGPADLSTDATMARTASADLQLLVGCDTVFAVIGKGDIGTCVEIGYAMAKGLDVFVVGEDLAGGSRVMLASDEVSFFDDLTTAVYATVFPARS